MQNTVLYLYTCTRTSTLYFMGRLSYWKIIASIKHNLQSISNQLRDDSHASESLTPPKYEQCGCVTVATCPTCPFTTRRRSPASSGRTPIIAQLSRPATCAGCDSCSSYSHVAGRCWQRSHSSSFTSSEPSAKWMRATYCSASSRNWYATHCWREQLI